MSLRVLAVMPLLLLPLVVSACTSGDGSVPTEVMAGPSKIGEALAMVPAGTDAVTYVDRDAIASIHEVADVTRASPGADLVRYRQALLDFASQTDIATSVSMDLALGELDVDWQVVGSSGGTLQRVWGIDEDVDLEAVGDRLLADGFVESSVDGRRRFRASLADAPGYPTPLLDVTLLVEEQLVIGSSSPRALLEVIKGIRRSLADTGRFHGVIQDVEDVYAASLSRGRDVCPAPNRFDRDLGIDLGFPRVLGTLVHGSSEDFRSVLVFRTDAEAAADSDARDQLEAGDVVRAEGDGRVVVDHGPRAPINPGFTNGLDDAAACVRTPRETLGA